MHSRPWLAIGAGLFLATGAQAEVVTLSGTQFDLRYDTTAVGLFGAPTLVGNTILFTPSAFSAQSINGTGSSTEMSSLAIELIAHFGFRFSSFGIGEAGDYRLSGAGSSVGVSGVLSAADAGVGSPVATAALALNPATPLGLADGGLHDWVASASIDNVLAPWLGGSSNVAISLSNILTAQTLAGFSGPQSAFIEKKFAGVALTVNGVPTPGTVPLVGLALLVLTALARAPFHRRRP